MIHTIRSIIFDKAPLKVISLLLGYGLWLVFAPSRTKQVRLKVPVAFYNVENHTIEAPESIVVTLQGQRAQLHRLNIDDLAVHLNAKQFEPGKHVLQLTHDHLFLPDQIKLIHYIPSNVVITIS